MIREVKSIDKNLNKNFSKKVKKNINLLQRKFSFLNEKKNNSFKQIVASKVEKKFLRKLIFFIFKEKLKVFKSRQ